MKPDMNSRAITTAAAAVLLLGACDPRLTPTSDLTSREVQSLAGVWTGRSTLRTGERYCPANYLWTLRVGGGNIDAEVVDADTPRAPPTKFTTFIDYDGSMSAFTRLGGRDTNVRGAFIKDGFAGQSQSQECSYFIRLRRASGS